MARCAERLFAMLLQWLLLCLVTGSAIAGMSRYQHASGLSFEYPGAWTLREDDEGLLLMPPGGAQAGGGAPREYFRFGLSEAAGITTASDPRVLAYFEHSIAGDIPGSRRNGQVSTFATGVGEAVLIPFAGTLRGIESDILVYVVVQEAQGLYLIHVRDRAASSDRQMGKRLFSSLQLQYRIDPDLIGSWARTERTSSGDSSHFSTTHLVGYEFDATGGVAMKSDFSTSSVSDDVSILTDGASGYRGRYSTLGEKLYIEWEDGAKATWIYSVFPDYNDGHLILKLHDPDSGKPKFYHRMP